MSQQHYVVDVVDISVTLFVCIIDVSPGSLSEGASILNALKMLYYYQQNLRVHSMSHHMRIKSNTIVLLISMSLWGFSRFAFPSTQVRCCIRCASVLSSPLSIVHIVDCVPVDFPRKVNSDQTKDQPAEQDLEYGDSHVVGEPVVNKLREEGQAAVSDAGQELKVPRLLHSVRLVSFNTVNCSSDGLNTSLRLGNVSV